MNWEAVIVVSVAMIVLGAILLVPGMLWAKYKLKNTPHNASGKFIVTKFGIVYFILFILCFLAALTIRHFYPEINPITNLAMVFIIFLIGTLGALFMEKIGIKIIIKPNENSV